MILPWKNECITFERFMEFCLYDPECGYYTTKSKVIGRKGDFYTSPHMHPMFGQILADAFVFYFDLCSKPKPFHIVELGAGEGLLREQILTRLRHWYPQIYEQVEYMSVEVNEALPDEIQGVVFSNELFDALPVHRVRVRGGEVREIFVNFGDQISEKEGDITDSRILNYMKLGFDRWCEGNEYEVNLRMVDQLEALEHRIKSGVVLTIDYGYDWEEYNSEERASGTLLCYHRHQTAQNPYLNLGDQDITAHVNFQVMQKTGDRLGWRSQPLKRQREFMLEWGLEKVLIEEENRGFLNPDRIETRLGLKELLVPGGISDTMKVLVQKVRLS